MSIIGLGAPGRVHRSGGGGGHRGGGGARSVATRTSGGITDLTALFPAPAPPALMFTVERGGQVIGSSASPTDAKTLALAASKDGSDVTVKVGTTVLAIYKGGRASFAALNGAGLGCAGCQNPLGDAVTVNLPEGAVKTARELAQDPKARMVINNFMASIRKALAHGGAEGLEAMAALPPGGGRARTNR